MKRSLFRAVLQSLLVIFTLVLTPSKLLGQEIALTPASGEPRLAGTVETASIELVPPAPLSASSSLRTSATGDATVFHAAPVAPASAVAMGPMAFVTATAPSKMSPPHAFWDRENRVLFTTVGALATADFFATHANLASGGKELNPLTRVLSGSTPGLAANFALETAGVMGLSYVFHKTGHHKLERITALVDIGASGAAAGFSFAHR